LTRSRIAAGGYPGQPSHPICHGVGARAHEPPYAHQAGTGTIRKGMVLAIEPGIYWPGGGGLRLEDNFGSRMRGIKNSARIQMIFGWRVPPAKRDELVTTPARNVNPASGLDPKMVERILAAVCEEEIVAMACDVINIPSPYGRRATNG